MKEQQFRVTSIPLLKYDYTILTGVPIKENSYRLNSGKYIVTAIIDSQQLPVKPSIGQHWKIVGEPQFKTVDSNGYTLKQHLYDQPDTFECLMPDSGESFICFIADDSEFKGIGDCKARELWDMFGSKIYNILKEDTEVNKNRLNAILTTESIISLYTGFEKYKNLEYANWLSSIGVPYNIQKRLFKHHGSESISHIKKNPYLLLGFGMSFTNIDAIAFEHFHTKPDNTQRLASAVEAAIKNEVDKGHTYTSQKDIKYHIQKMLGSKELAATALMAGHEKIQFMLNYEKGTYHPTAIYIMELVVAKRLLALTEQRNLYNNETNNAYLKAVSELPYKLTERQEEAVVTALDSGVASITGGAGTGKTTVLKTAVQAYHELGYKIHPTALSGRAAMRLHESISFDTSTIAALLHGKPIEPKDGIDKHLVVIDEASMVDIPTMYRIVTHIHPSVHILLTGDPDQLPPIGCGKVLSDVVSSGVITNTTLDIVKRQKNSTGIPEYSKAVNDGKIPENLSTGAITFHDISEKQIVEKCTELYIKSPSNSRIMAPTRSLVIHINQLCQKCINETGQPIQIEVNGEWFYSDIRKGDIVLFNKNNYEHNFQNGSLGKLISIDKSGDVLGKVELDTGTKIEVTPDVLDCMELGYAITLHKAQGSQFPRIIIALKNGRIVDRAWLYTAITRAESEIHIVGSVSDFKRIIKDKSHTNKRNSYLANLLKHPQ